MYNVACLKHTMVNFGRKSIFVGRCGDISKIIGHMSTLWDPLTRVTLIAVQVSLVS